MTPEQLLWQAVVFKAARDATAVDPSGDENRAAKIQADSWLRGGSRDFREACSNAGMDPAFIREAYVSGRIDAELLRTAEKEDQ